jgi:hypothetical protein
MGLFGAATPVAYNFTDICNQISVAAASRDFGSQVALEAQAGTNYNADTGVITMDLSYASVSCCGIAGLTFSYSLTPQN